MKTWARYLIVVVILQSVATHAKPMFQGLGSLSDAPLSSSASGISGDGRVIVGRTHSSEGGQAFKWSTDVGMVGIGDSTLR